MLEIIREAGVSSLVSLGVLLLGLANVLLVHRRGGQFLNVATGFAVAIVAIGMSGQATGQRLVWQAVESRAVDAATRVELLNIGTKEAAMNLLVAGLCALLLMVCAAVLSLFSRRVAATSPAA